MGKRIKRKCRTKLKRALVKLYTYQNIPKKRRGLYILSPFAKPLTQRLINHPGHSSLFLLAVVLQMGKQISLDRNGLLDGFFGRIFFGLAIVITSSRYYNAFRCVLARFKLTIEIANGLRKCQNLKSKN